jgi:hypothetical protein
VNRAALLLGAPTFSNCGSRTAYVAGIVAPANLDRFLSYGVYLRRFYGGTWYRVPARAAAELRRLTQYPCKRALPR